jgi:hypothetical protein
MNILRTCVPVLAIACLAGAARADLVRFTFSGTFDTVSGPVQAPVQVGQPFTFTYVFDTSTPDSDPAPNFGLYAGAIVSASVTSGSFQFSASPGDISVLNNGFAGDTYTARIEDAIRFAQVGLTDFQFGAFNDDHLPADLPFADFDIRRFTLHGDVGPTFWEAQGEITSFTRQAVCYADCNQDGVLGLADFGCFQTKFALGDPYADCNGDGVLGLADFGCFQTKFALGCP